MPHDSRTVSETTPKESIGSLGSCLVEGDPEQRSHERRVRRRSLIISILTQAAVVALLILLPLFGKTERIAMAISTPIPPYSSYRGPSHDPGGPHPQGPQRTVCHFCIPHSISPIIVTRVPPTDGTDNAAPDGLVPGFPGGPRRGDLIPITDGRTNVPPPPPDRHVTRPTLLRITQLDPATLTHRVEPLYPTLPKQMHKEGRVELRAIIATDGSIKSLEVVGGDPMFFQSALDAVSQWHYKPTILNGQAVEIDTHISVLYTMPH